MNLIKKSVCVIFIVLVIVALFFNIKITENAEMVVPLPQEPPKPVPVLTDFTDTAFIGDSRTQGFMMYSGITEAEFFTGTGITVYDVVNTPLIPSENGEITIIEALKQKEYKNVLIMLGINELGWKFDYSFSDSYKIMLDEIKLACPNAEIFLQAIMPVNSSLLKNTEEYVNNENILAYNDIIKGIAEEYGLKYLDTHSLMADENGELFSDASLDGIHLNVQYCQRWTKFLKGEEL